MVAESLEGKLQRFDNPVQMMRNAQTGAYVFPIQAEFSNWLDEQEAWRKSVALFDLSLHMSDIYVEGPDTQRLLSDLSVNSFESFGRGSGKQLVVCNFDGYVIGDAILFGLEDDKVNITGRPTVGHWVAFHAETGDYDVRITRDERSIDNRGERLSFRYQVSGPNAALLIDKLAGSSVADAPFFSIVDLTIADIPVRALNHSMSRSLGFEIFGPREQSQIVRDAILEAGEEFGLRPVGARAYATVSPESGWYASPTPAIYSGEAMKSYREWLSAESWEGNMSMGGSFVSDNIEDYYHRPWDLGYGRLVKFDHDFVGRDALEAAADEPRRQKVWLRWNTDDVASVFRKLGEPGDRFKYLDMPAAYYAALPFDQVLVGDRLVGLSQYPVYTANAGCWFSLGLVDENEAKDGAAVAVVWGEEAGGTAKPIVERHVQTEIRATVSVTSPRASSGPNPGGSE